MTIIMNPYNAFHFILLSNIFFTVYSVVNASHMLCLHRFFRAPQSENLYGANRLSPHYKTEILTISPYDVKSTRTMIRVLLMSK